MISSATRSSPRVQRWMSGLSAGPSRRGLNARTNEAGDGPSTFINRSIDCNTPATRPNASAAAQKPATSRSAGAWYRRTIWMGSAAESAKLKDSYCASSRAFRSGRAERRRGMERSCLEAAGAFGRVVHIHGPAADDGGGDGALQLPAAERRVPRLGSECGGVDCDSQVRGNDGDVGRRAFAERAAG